MNTTFRTLTLISFSILVSGCQTTNQHANLYNKYSNSPNNKAFSVGVNGVAGAAWSSQTIEEAKSRANSACKNSGGMNCTVTEVNGKPIGTTSSATTSTRDPALNTTINNTYNLNSSQMSYTADLTIHSSGFFVNKYHILTTSYITDRCEKIRFALDGSMHDLDVVRVDSSNGLSLLKSAHHSEVAALISSDKLTRQGDRVLTYGYDLSDILNAGSPTYQGRITDGIVSSANGVLNDVRVMKITNNTNSGSIGGPVFNESGAVKGIITSKTENAIKASMLDIFLSEAGVAFRAQSNSKTLSTSSIAESGKSITVPLVCFNSSK